MTSVLEAISLWLFFLSALLLGKQHLFKSPIVAYPFQDRPTWSTFRWPTDKQFDINPVSILDDPFDLPDFCFNFQSTCLAKLCCNDPTWSQRSQPSGCNGQVPELVSPCPILLMVLTPMTEMPTVLPVEAVSGWKPSLWAVEVVVLSPKSPQNLVVAASKLAGCLTFGKVSAKESQWSG